MIDALKERELIQDRQRMHVHANLATLQKDGLVRAKWGSDENPQEIRRYFQVTEDGNRERSKVPVTSDSRRLAPGSIPAVEPT